MKNTRFSLSENFHFLVVKFSMYLNRRVFVMVKLGFKGVYIIFLISAQKHRLGGSNEYPQSMFSAEL